jgi:hypothetical protein
MSEMQPKAKKQKGPFDVSRTVLLAPASAERLNAAIQRLKNIEPIIDAGMDQHGRLRISYDASCVGIRDVEELLDEDGIGRASGLWWHLKSLWYRFLDENTRSNALSKGGACCSRPPPTLGKK